MRLLSGLGAGVCALGRRYRIDQNLHLKGTTQIQGNEHRDTSDTVPDNLNVIPLQSRTVKLLSCRQETLYFKSSNVLPQMTQYSRCFYEGVSKGAIGPCGAGPIDHIIVYCCVSACLQGTSDTVS